MSEDGPQVLGSKVICQVGVIVRDVEKSARAYADLFGVPTPKWSLTDPLDVAQTRYRGEPTEARAKLAFFQMGSISLELIEPVGGPSTWQEFLDAHGQGIHHIAFQIQGMRGQVEMLEQKGMPLVQRGEYTGGRYAYIDGISQLGVILELLENDAKE
jgi:methylmalonyl-CoA/ethylmalonyl-CoA epimerase